MLGSISHMFVPEFFVLIGIGVVIGFVLARRSQSRTAAAPYATRYEQLSDRDDLRAIPIRRVEVVSTLEADDVGGRSIVRR